MDQVPRYFETEPKSAIRTKGSHEVLMRKGGTSHKRLRLGQCNHHNNFGRMLGGCSL
jgi:hypothetical protein